MHPKSVCQSYQHQHTRLLAHIRSCLTKISISIISRTTYYPSDEQKLTKKTLANS